ncbi:hypothetical protein BT101_26120, partial [Vibrio parahaemolyticus]|uniref:hypothetical protein n=1 Tax=Vibrio parahaemolyticus TaxID=670 RepID=UPI0009440E7A
GSPAPAVIPAPIAYIKVVAVKKLVVGFLAFAVGPPSGVHCIAVAIFDASACGIRLSGALAWSFTVKKLECLKQALLEYISME